MNGFDVAFFEGVAAGAILCSIVWCVVIANISATRARDAVNPPRDVIYHRTDPEADAILDKMFEELYEVGRRTERHRKG